jgi:hypothetical protein
MREERRKKKRTWVFWSPWFDEKIKDIDFLKRIVLVSC